MSAKLVERFRHCASLFGETAKLMVGIPNYERYVAHTREKHPEREPMSYAEFVRERQEARYGGSRPGRCC
jgi:uncharacterized short protein YbdD (DUF466 family)